jgi:hypothetical protein
MDEYSQTSFNFLIYISIIYIQVSLQHCFGEYLLSLNE